MLKSLNRFDWLPNEHRSCLFSKLFRRSTKKFSMISFNLRTTIEYLVDKHIQAWNKYDRNSNDTTNLNKPLFVSLSLFDCAQSENNPLTGSLEGWRKKRDESHKHLWVSSACCNKFRMIVVCIPPMRAAFLTRQLRPASARSFFWRDARLSPVLAITVVHYHHRERKQVSRHRFLFALFVPRISRQPDCAIVFSAKASPIGSTLLIVLQIRASIRG